MNCCICFPIESRLTDQMRETARQYRRVFPTRPFFLLAPDAHPLIREYEELLAPIHVRRLPSTSFTNPLALARVRMTPEFYGLFAGYDYVLVTSLLTWPLYDALDWWMARGYGYTAAPWLSLGGSGSTWIRGLDRPVGGRECASLRHVGSMREYARRLQICGFDLVKHPIFEDIVLSGGLPEDKVRDLPPIAYCPRAEQARFAWDRPSCEPGDADCDVRTLMAITRGRMPMLMFNPQETAYRRFCVPDEDPETVFMFSSAVKATYDYEAAVDCVEPDPSKRLLVFMNFCNAFRNNDSGLRLVKSQRRILTFHNDTVTPPFGPAGFGEIPLFLEKAGYAGRHDARTLRWRSWNGKTQSVVTYDGEIPDEGMTATLRSVGPEVVKGSPTCGYQAYRILRAKYPKARIVLVNFFGNTNGFTVCSRHDPGWEQAVYAKDPNVLMIGTKERE